MSNNSAATAASCRQCRLPRRALQVFFAFASAISLSAATKTWDGSSNGNWNTMANWAGNVVPVDGDDLVFPANAARVTITNDISGLNLRSITISGTNYTIRGNSITLTNGIVGSHTNGSCTIDFPIQLDASQTFNCTNGGCFL